MRAPRSVRPLAAVALLLACGSAPPRPTFAPPAWLGAPDPASARPAPSPAPAPGPVSPPGPPGESASARPATAPAASAPPAARRPDLDCPGNFPEWIFGTPLLLIGDILGTQEGPATAGMAACVALRRRGAVVVAVDLPRTASGDLESFLDGDASPVARTALLRSPAFAREFPDGRTSEAMLELLERLRTWRRAGASVEVVPFDDRSVVGEARDRAIAALLVPIRTRTSDRPMIVLIGNLRASTDVGTVAPGYVPVGRLLEDDGLPVKVFWLAYRGGTYWGCVPRGPGLGCGVQGADRWPEGGIDAWPPPRKLIRPRWPADVPSVREIPRYRGVDGLVYVGSLHPSPPARP